MIVEVLKRFVTVLVGGTLLLGGCADSEAPALPLASLSVPADCEVQQRCLAGDEALSVEVRFGKQPRALQPFPVNVKLTGTEAAEAVYVVFSMPGMDMGLNRYQLRGDSISAWNADITLPICLAGRSDWIASFELLFPARRVLLDVPFVLEK